MYLSAHNPFMASIFFPILAIKGATNTTNWDITNIASGIFSTIEASSSTIDGVYPQLAPKIPVLANYMHKIQAYMWFPSGVICLAEALQTISLLDKQFAFFPQEWVQFTQGALRTYMQIWISPSSIVANIGGFAVIGISIAIALRVVKAANNYFWREASAEKLLENQLPSEQKIAYTHPTGELNHQAQLALRIVCCLASLSLNFTPLGVCSLALQTYSLISIAQRQWVKYSVCVKFPPNPKLESLTLNLFLRIFSSFPSEKDNCSFCLEELADKNTKIESDGRQGVLLCSRHIFHLKCVVDWFNKKMPELPRAMANPRREENKMIMDLPTKHLPSCPLCRSQPAYRVEGEIASLTDTKYDVEVVLVN